MTYDEIQGTLERELACVAAREAELRAWVVRHPLERLRAEVAALPAGPLHGFTLGVKDIVDTADLPTERGSPIYAGRRPTADAACVALARAAGALLVGKTVTTELAYFQPGPTRNPHDPTRTPGGSSSGSAAAVAAGMVRIAFGTQTAGSVIRPGSFCGVVALKPTFDLAPLTGVHPLAPSFDTLGWYGRTLDDVTAVLEAIGPPAAASAAAPGGGAERVGAAGRAARPRLGLYRGHDWAEADSATVDAVEGAAAALVSAGAEVVELDPLADFEPLGRAHESIMLAEATRALAWERLRHSGQLSDRLAELLDTGRSVDGRRYGAAQLAAQAGRRAHEDAFERNGLDALLTAAAPGEAPRGLERTGNPIFNRVWTLLGMPALTLPAHRGPAGLPVGIQLVGLRWEDRALLDVARLVSGALGLDV